MGKFCTYLAQYATCSRTTSGPLLALNTAHAYLSAMKMFLTEKFPECETYRCFDKTVYKTFMTNIYKIKNERAMNNGENLVNAIDMADDEQVCQSTKLH